MAHGQMEYLQRTQQIALGEDSEADRAMTALRAFGIGYASPLAVIKRGPFHYEVITELPKEVSPRTNISGWPK